MSVAICLHLWQTEVSASRARRWLDGRGSLHPLCRMSPSSDGRVYWKTMQRTSTGSAFIGAWLLIPLRRTERTVETVPSKLLSFAESDRRTWGRLRKKLTVSMLRPQKYKLGGYLGRVRKLRTGGSADLALRRLGVWRPEHSCRRRASQAWVEERRGTKGRKGEGRGNVAGKERGKRFIRKSITDSARPARGLEGSAKPETRAREFESSAANSRPQQRRDESNLTHIYPAHLYLRRWSVPHDDAVPSEAFDENFTIPQTAPQSTSSANRVPRTQVRLSAPTARLDTCPARGRS